MIMTQEEQKRLLLRDLCARLPYGIKVSYYGTEEEMECWDEVEGICDRCVEVGQYGLPIERVKPYLFPLSSMTEKQENQYREVIASSLNHYEVYDWLNKNHFDYRGLIEKGLAIDATDKNIY